MEPFPDENRHAFFNTNNLWLDLQALRETLRQHDGVLGLPLIRNEKTVDPADPSSPKAAQVESEMGAAIAAFPGAQAICVGRDRFLPVKTTNELMLLRSGRYELDEDGRLVARAEAPAVVLDKHYKLVQDFTRLVPQAPSLVEATSLEVEGEVTFGRDVRVVGDAVVRASEPATLPDGTVLSGEVRLDGDQ